MEKIDCRGLNCPEPVIRTKNALAKHPAVNLNIVVDNETARENVLRFVRGQVSNIYDITDLLFTAEKVITI